MIIKMLQVAAVALSITAVAAHADTIDFSQFGPDGTTSASPLVGTTTMGDTVTLTSPNGSFLRLTEGTTWHGIFPLTAPILFDGSGPGAITLTFANPITSLVLAGQSNAYGAYTETAVAYDGLTIVDTVSASSFNHVNDMYPFYTGTVPFLTLTGAHITSVVWSATNDGVGLALYGGAGVTVPEPAALALFGLGLVGIAAARRRTR